MSLQCWLDIVCHNLITRSLIGGSTRTGIGSKGDDVNGTNL